MAKKISTPADYARTLEEIKNRVRAAQYEALKAVNRELVSLYWDIGRMIAKRQKEHGWGKSVVETLARDLQKEFPGMSGFSVQNLWYMRQFYLAYAAHPKLQPLVGEISEFKPEYVGKMQFYLAALDDQVRLPDENPSIGMILCRTKKRAVVEYALRESNKPIGVAAYRMVRRLPAELKGKLPAPKQIERLLEAVELPRNSGEGV